MENLYRVAIRYNDNCGYLEYNEDNKAVSITLEDSVKKAEIAGFLQTDHEIQVPQDTLMDFSKQIVHPLADLASLKLALTRLWGETGVYVDWSRPIQVSCLK